MSETSDTILLHEILAELKAIRAKLDKGQYDAGYAPKAQDSTAFLWSRLIGQLNGKVAIVD